MSASGPDSLPELPSSRGLTERGPGRKHTLTAPPASSDTSRQQLTSSPRLLLNRTAPVFVSPRSQQSRRVSDYVRLSRSELEHKEQALSSLRSVNVALQSRVRKLEGHQQVAVMLTGVCRQLASNVGCTAAGDGIATETMADMLTSRVTTLVNQHSQTHTQLCSVREELERVRGELAAAEVKVTSTETQLRGLESAVTSKEALHQQLKVELETSQQSTARCTAMIQSLRQQLSSVERERDSNQSTHHSMQTEIGRLQQQLRDTESAMKSVEEQLSSSREEHTILRERAEVADSAYEEVCGQLGELLLMDGSTADYWDIDMVMEKVTALIQDNEALHLKLDTITHSSRSAELDAKANRETILRLVSQSKRHEKEAEKVPSLQERVALLEEELACGQRERASLLERLEATRGTVTALERELMAKNNSIAELQNEVQAITAEYRQEQADHKQYRDFYHDISATMSSSQQEGGATVVSSDVIAIINRVHQGSPQLEDELRTSTAQLATLQARVESSQLMVDRAEQSLERERERVSELETQLSVTEGFRHQLDKQQQKCEMLYQRLGRALSLDNASCGILAGDIGEDSIIVRAQQLVNMETQAVQEKQAMVYSLQRKLKSSRQALESRDLQVSLLQRKACGLEERMAEVVKKEAEMNAVLDRGHKMTRQLEKLQSTVVQQREAIARLKVDSESLDKLKVHCAHQEQQLAASSAELTQLQQARVQQAQQLAETRQRAQLAANKEKGALDKMEADLLSLRKELEERKGRERQLVDFKTTVETIVTSQPTDHAYTDHTHQQGAIIGQLEQLLASRLTHQARAHSLEASLKELERGFRTSYQDALSTLASH